MNTERKNFIVIDEPFVCAKCGKKNPASGVSCRNHCKFCLFSKHVDSIVPGDRNAACHGLMAPLYVIFDAKKGYMIAHKCQSCARISLNKAAEGDNINLLTNLINADPFEARKHEKSRRKNFGKK